jgi:hypothetical protein
MGTSLHWQGKEVLLNLPGLVKKGSPVQGIPIYLPNWLLYRFIPFYDRMRAWMRYGVYVSLFTSILAGIGYAAVVTKLNRRILRWVLFCGVLIAILIDFYPVASTMTQVKTNSIDSWLADQPGQGAYVYFPIHYSVLPDLFYGTLYNNKPFMGVYGGSYLPKQFRRDLPKLAKFPDGESMNVLKERGVQYVIVDAANYPNWHDFDQKLLGNGMTELAVIGNQHIYELPKLK